jgi:hypothetical protein
MYESSPGGDCCALRGVVPIGRRRRNRGQCLRIAVRAGKGELGARSLELGGIIIRDQPALNL